MMISLFKQFLIKIAIRFLRDNNYEVCSRETGIAEVKDKKWFWTRKLSPGEINLLLKIFEGKDV